ncbi:unnamed protein product [Penicillium salamii]|nr:unnamed protein product [Penicillium salamii]CAG8172033.1 unnamed protein product [Penicillium salamii]CAG8243048.1 unnamed protein product [Penicillium salamii]
MKVTGVLLASLASCAAAYPSRAQSSKPPFFVLAGDSTTAVQSAGGGGWGDGFLNTTLFNGASGRNLGHNGATTVSFRTGGDWAEVLATVKKSKDAYRPFVTIQFGHNDQKPAANISLSQYTKNLEGLVKEVLDAGATPILVTPLSRRGYETSSGTPRIVQNLANETAATIQAAHSTDVKVIDLNKASTDYLNAIGPDNAYTYNLNPTDYTHLNGPGSVVFGGIVADLIIQVESDLAKDGYLKVDKTLKKDVNEGVYYWP